MSCRSSPFLQSVYPEEIPCTQPAAERAIRSLVALSGGGWVIYLDARGLRSFSRTYVCRGLQDEHPAVSSCRIVSCGEQPALSRRPHEGFGRLAALPPCFYCCDARADYMEERRRPEHRQVAQQPGSYRNADSRSHTRCAWNHLFLRFGGWPWKSLPASSLTCFCLRPPFACNRNRRPRSLRLPGGKRSIVTLAWIGFLSTACTIVPLLFTAEEDPHPTLTLFKIVIMTLVLLGSGVAIYRSSRRLQQFDIAGR